VSWHGRTIGLGLALVAAWLLAPATASAAGLVAAYDRYVTGKGFEIGLVNALTGATLALPAGVNTNDDELHPALTPDGRYLVFMRTKLLPKLNGDIVPPESRTLFVADRETGTVTSLNRTGAGPVFASASRVGWGVRPFQNAGQINFTFVSVSNTFTAGAISAGQTGLGSPPTGGLVETVHADHGAVEEFNFQINNQQTVDARYLSYAVLDPTTGALQSQTVQFTTYRNDGTGFGPGGTAITVGSTSQPAGHPVVRSDDYTAFHMGGDIQTRTFPADDLAVAPEPITTSAPERDPAWSPDELNLGFIRTVDGQRRLGVFNATPGIQTILNPLASLGPEAPTPQTRAYQEVWGGLSIAEGAPSSAPAMICDATCRARLQRPRGPMTILSPTLSINSQIGIFVARVVGKRKLLGRTAPRLRVIGKVPLGAAKRGRIRKRWDGKVNGKRLRPGTYLLTYRSLRGRKVTNTSDSIRLRVGRGGRILRARPERVPR
jgi:hypothetical protein